jgi:GNAT superfamily N-acetyltransferase
MAKQVRFLSIRSYDPKEEIEEYLTFLLKHYRGNRRLSRYMDEVRLLLSSGNPFLRHLTLMGFYIRGKGHCIAGFDIRRKEEGFIGFFDCIDKEIGISLLREAEEYLRLQGCKTVYGPINLSLWHGYRFIVSAKRKPTLFDPMNQSWYADLWKGRGYKEVSSFVSAVRNDFNYILSPTAKDYEKVCTSFTTRHFQEGDLRYLWEITNAVFATERSIIPLSFEDFSYLYGPLVTGLDKRLVHLIEDCGNPVSFCFCVPNPLEKGQIIVKTLAVLPEYRNRGIAAALLYSVHLEAQRAGFTEAYYPFIKKGNVVTKFSYQGYEIVTEYSWFFKALDCKQEMKRKIE